MSLKNMLKIVTFLLITLLVLPTPFSSKASTKNPLLVQPFELFKNPVVGDGADPWIVKHTDGYYYYTQTTGRDITVWKSKTLSDIGKGEKKVVWTPSDTAPNRDAIWAPELHFIDGKWYIYFAASEGDTTKQRMYVLESESADPFGPYHHPKGTDYGKIADPSDKWAIDGTILEYKKKMYFVWSGWEGDENVSQNLYIAPMENPWTISGNRVEISRPELDWEKNGFPLINEGPEILKNKKGQVFIIYSASGSWTDDYCLGMLALNGKNPLDPQSWTKNPTPVFEKNPDMGVYGPGHSSFVQSPDGKEDWIVYHAAKFSGAGWNRNVRMQKFSWNKDGTPNFDVPVAADTLLQKPSGESKGKIMPSLPGVVYKYEAEEATINHSQIVNNTSASGGKKVGKIDFSDSFVEFNAEVPAGEYTMKIRYGNGMGQQSSHYVTVNGQSLGEVIYPSNGWDTWQDAEIKVNLENQNKIRISKGQLYAELDRIELIPIQTKVFKYEAEHAKGKKATVLTDALASNGQTVKLDRNSQIDFPIQVSKAGKYELKIKSTNDQETITAPYLYVNNKLMKPKKHSGKGSDLAETQYVELKAGKNVIKLKQNHQSIEIDYISVMKSE